MTNGKPKSLASHWEDGEHCSCSNHLETGRKSGQLLEVVPVLRPPQTNDAVKTSQVAVPAEQVSHELKGERRRKMTTPHKVCTQEAQSERNLNISQRPLFTTLKPPPSHKRTVPCRGIKKTRHSAVCHGQMPANKGRDKTLGCLGTKRVTPPVQTSPNNRTPILTQPDTSSRHPAILQRKKWASVSPLRDDRAIKITATRPEPAHLPTAPQTTPGAGSAKGPETSEAPLLIHSLSAEDYQSVYHSVVDPRLCTASGNPRRPNLELGRVIKQRLWERLFCPRLREEVQPDGRVTVTETFCHPGFFQHAPLMEVDVSDEPAPEHAERRRAQPDTHKMED
ncbi:hypothetical protein ACEWY4_011243 [Coilia grayii]|uniref:Uncharacterized protein n=1 Tax=Coilia grayii TaxID=363190 RepID=A0ABD1K4G9_9TELE